MNDKIMTLHPDPTKKGVNLDRAKYDFIRRHIEQIVADQQPLTPTDLFNAMQDFQSEFDGKIGWYTITVKLDLEARGTLKHDRKTCMITIA